MVRTSPYPGQEPLSALRGGVGGRVSGNAEDYRPCAARCTAHFNASSSFLDSRVGPPPKPVGPTHVSGPEQAAFTSESGATAARFGAAEEVCRDRPSSVSLHKPLS